MHIYNQNGEPIGPDATALETSLSQMRGLLFRPHKKEFCLLFTFKRPVLHSIHMMFVFYPIDIVFLDGQKMIIELKEQLRPFSVYHPKKGYVHFIEIPAGSIQKYGLKEKDHLHWQDTPCR